MSDFLQELVESDLLPRIDGDDSRFAKISRASAAVAKQLSDSPNRLLPAMFAGISPDVPEDDTEVAAAEEALREAWAAHRSVHTDRPVGLYQAILLSACLDAAQGQLRVALWLAAASELQFVRPEKQQRIFADRVKSMAWDVERELVSMEESSAVGEPPRFRSPPHKTHEASTFAPFDEVLPPAELTKLSFQPGAGNWQNHAQRMVGWAQNLQTQLTAVLRVLYDGMGGRLQQRIDDRASLGGEQYKKLAEAQTNYSKQQRDWGKAVSAQQLSTRVQIVTLWWSEAMYCETLAKSYRDLDPQIATVVMPLELSLMLTRPASAAVRYLLEETLAKLPSVRFDEARPVEDLLNSLRVQGEGLGSALLKLRPPTTAPSLLGSVFGAIDAVGSDRGQEPSVLAGRYSLPLSLPKISHAIFMQAQAWQLVTRGL